jgi:hypothetical protein
MFLLGVLHNGHEAVRQDGDENRHNQKVTDDEEDGHDGFAEDIVACPVIPSSRREAHDDLKDDVSHSIRIDAFVRKGKSKGDEESRTKD